MPAPPASRFRFNHRLTLDAAYHALLRRNRALLHSSTADALASQLRPGTPGERDRLAELQRQLEGAGRLDEAFERCCELMNVMVDSGQLAGWAALRESALELWAGLRRNNPALPELATALLRVEGFAQRMRGNLDEAERCLLQAAQQAQAEQQAQLEASALLGLGGIVQSRGLAEEALAWFEAALDPARSSVDERAVIRALNAAGVALSILGRHSDAIKALNEAVATAASSGNRKLHGMASGNLGVSYYTLGRNAEAEECFRLELAAAETLGDPRAESYAVSHLGTLLREQGRLAEARGYFDRDLQLSELLDDRAGVGHAYGTLSGVLEDEGDLGRALDFAGRATAIMRELGDARFTGNWLGSTGALLTKLGRLDEAMAALAEAHELVRPTGDHWTLGWLEVYSARLALANARLLDPAERGKQHERAAQALQAAREQALVSNAGAESALAQAIEQTAGELPGMQDGPAEHAPSPQG